MLLKETGLTAEDIKAKVNKYMIETYERFDFVAETAKDMYVRNEKGEAYLDFYAGIAVNSVGSCNPAVVEAVQEQAGQIMQTFNYPYTIPQALLAEKVCTATGMDKIFFQNSGAEANEAMIKMARKYGVEKYGPNKYNIVTAANSFHGRTFGAMSATGQPDNACQIGFGGMTPGFTYTEYNNLDAFKAACTENTAAIMIEPVQGEGGVNPGAPEFMKGLRRFCDENGILLLLDEVQTGWCRTGAVMSYMNYGIKPDIVSMAKAMGGGMPIGAICATKEAAKAFTPGSHGSTFGGHPVCCAAALAAVTELLDRDLAGNAKKMGGYFMSLLRTLPHVKEVRGQGLLVGVEFEDGLNSVEVKHACFDRKLLITAIGSNIIRMIPPLIVTKNDCKKAFEIIEAAVHEVYSANGLRKPTAA
ncbi:MAG: acetylornithine/succinylornithine family transaminase [Lachnospiraceae bacterium]